jgi:hypothetical protein
MAAVADPEGKKAVLLTAFSNGAAIPTLEGGVDKKALPPWAEQGDWLCPKCNDLQFARNDRCRMCGGQRSDALQDPSNQSAAKPYPAFSHQMTLTDPTLVEFATKWRLNVESQELLKNLPEGARNQVLTEFSPKDTTRDANRVFMKFAQGKEEWLARQGSRTSTPAPAFAGIPAVPAAAPLQNTAAMQQQAAVQQYLAQLQQAQMQQYLQYAAQVQQAQLQQAALAQQQQQPQQQGVAAQLQAAQQQAAIAQMQAAMLQQPGQQAALQQQALPAPVAALPAAGQAPQAALPGQDPQALQAQVAMPQAALPDPSQAQAGMMQAAPTMQAAQMATPGADMYQVPLQPAALQTAPGAAPAPGVPLQN